MKILNLYAGIGGNRKLWTPNGDEHEITAVELNPSIARIYHDFFPNDIMVVGDAHQYLLDHFKEFDFIWSSPPCPTHSRIRKYSAVARGQNKPVYPNMMLYQEILLLQHHHEGKWVVENVIPYYSPLIDAMAEINRHLFWSNFYIKSFKHYEDRKHDNIKSGSTVYGFNLDGYDINDKTKCLRNMVNPETAMHILNMAIGVIHPIQEGLFEGLDRE